MISSDNVKMAVAVFQINWWLVEAVIQVRTMVELANQELSPIRAAKVSQVNIPLNTLNL